MLASQFHATVYYHCQCTLQVLFATALCNEKLAKSQTKVNNLKHSISYILSLFV